MAGLKSLYQQQILDHGRNPRNFGTLADATSSAEGNNPLCGDQVHIWVRVVDGELRQVKFQGEGCAITTASASMMTQALEGKRCSEALAMIASFDALVGSFDEVPSSLSELAAFTGLREFPTRIKCATLPWHTARAALNASPKVVSTE